MASSRCSHRIVAVLSHHLVAFVGRYRPSVAAMMTGGVHFRHPGRRWQLCETPYFATRGRGDMRGVPNRSCTQSHPGGGAGLCYRCGLACIILCTTWLCGAMTVCHHLRGGILGCRFVAPACRRHPGRRNTGLRTATTAYRGWKLHRLWSSLRYSRSSGDGILCRMVLLHYCLLKKVCPAPRGAGHGDTSSVKLGYFTTTDCVLTPVLTM